MKVRQTCTTSASPSLADSVLPWSSDAQAQFSGEGSGQTVSRHLFFTLRRRSTCLPALVAFLQPREDLRCASGRGVLLMHAAVCTTAPQRPLNAQVLRVWRQCRGPHRTLYAPTPNAPSAAGHPDRRCCLMLAPKHVLLSIILHAVTGCPPSSKRAPLEKAMGALAFEHVGLPGQVCCQEQ